MLTPRPSLPREITDLILDELALGSSTKCLPALLACATAHSSFVDPCQKHIFREVTLLSPPADPEERTVGAFAGTLLFAATITGCPRLASYVQRLTYHLDNGEIQREFIDHHLKKKTVLDAMGKLPNLANLVFQSSAARVRRMSAIDYETTQVLVSILRSRQLQSLALVLVLCDSRIVRDLPRVKSLSLFRAAFVDEFDDTHDHTQIPQDCHHHPPLEALTCDSYSSAEIDSYLLRMEQASTDGTVEGSGRDACSPFRRIQRLRMYSGVPQGVFELDEGYGSLLRHAMNLRELNMTCDLNAPSIISQTEPPRSPLENLNEASFSTLTHFTFKLLLHLYSPNFAIRHPYMRLCDTDLPNLVELQFLRIHLILQGHGLDVDESQSFGSQWGQLCDVLTRPDAFPKLREVAVRVTIRVSPEIDEETINPSTLEHANNLEQRFATSVAAQFQALETRHCEGTLAFSFKAEVSCGGWICLDDCEKVAKEDALRSSPRLPGLEMSSPECSDGLW